MSDGAVDDPDLRGESKEGGEGEGEKKRVFYDDISVSDEDESELLARKELIDDGEGEGKSGDGEEKEEEVEVEMAGADEEGKEGDASGTVAFDDNDNGGGVDAAPGATAAAADDAAAAAERFNEPDFTVMNSIEPSQMNNTVSSVSELSRFNSFTLERIALEQGDASLEGRVAQAMLRNSNNERFRAGERPADTSIHGYERARPFRMQDAVRSGSGGPEGEDAFSERLATIQGMFKDAIFRKGGTGKAALAQLRRAFRLADMDNSGTINWDEFVFAIRESYGLRELSYSELQIIFSKFDDDGSGSVTYAEFVDAIKAMRGPKKDLYGKKIEVKTRVDLRRLAFEVRPARCNLGGLREGHRYELKLRVKNVGDADIRFRISTKAYAVNVEDAGEGKEGGEGEGKEAEPRVNTAIEVVRRPHGAVAPGIMFEIVVSILAVGVGPFDNSVVIEGSDRVTEMVVEGAVIAEAEYAEQLTSPLAECRGVPLSEEVAEAKEEAAETKADGEGAGAAGGEEKGSDGDRAAAVADRPIRPQTDTYRADTSSDEEEEAETKDGDSVA